MTSVITKFSQPLRSDSKLYCILIGIHTVQVTVEINTPSRFSNTCQITNKCPLSSERIKDCMSYAKFVRKKLCLYIHLVKRLNTLSHSREWEELLEVKNISVQMLIRSLKRRSLFALKTVCSSRPPSSLRFRLNLK